MLYTHPNICPPINVGDVVLGDLFLVHAQGPSGGGGSGLLDERETGRQSGQT